MAHDSASLARRRRQDRLDDHAAIDRLTDELLPALVAKLGANGLGELEVREGTWRVRLRMPADGRATTGRRSTAGRPGSRTTDAQRGDRPRSDAAGIAGAGASSAASGQAAAATPPTGPSRLIAVSPAVGFFRPRANLRAGTKVRAGDRIGSVDVLGIGQDVVAPGDGLTGATLVAAGEPVEYGQALIVLEQLGEPRVQVPGAAASADGTPAGADRVPSAMAAAAGSPADFVQAAEGDRADLAPAAGFSPAADFEPAAEPGPPAGSRAVGAQATSAPAAEGGWVGADVADRPPTTGDA